MKKIFFPGMIVVALIVISTSCKDSTKKENTQTESNTVGADSETDANKSDNRIDNAGVAKRPKGKMSFSFDGKSITIDENQVQCMYIGMNSNLAQSVISGGNQVTIVHMGIPKVGEIEITSIATMPSVAIQVIIDGVQYNNKKADDAKLALTKVTPDGKNYYVAGTFSGTLTSLDGAKTITITDGVFESAYL